MTGSVPGAGQPVSALEKRQNKAWTMLATKASRVFLPHPVPTSLPGAQSCLESSPSAHSLQPPDLTLFLLIEVHFLSLVS